ncbi:C-type lectin domain family 14 member A [Ambystoma mexicanum]|uniref:C-type lectin domain family 14 member A n=1 Tax=Ambystoma mexicanum TaxID=8296 RepID=UPI0037E75EA9
MVGPPQQTPARGQCSVRTMGSWGLLCLQLQAASWLISTRAALGQAPAHTLCSERGLCYTLHPADTSYSKAEEACGPQGGLTSMKDEAERQSVLGLLDRGATGLGKFWIGLRKPSSHCVVKDRPLRGFRWSNGSEASDVDLWASDPKPTCTSTYCVALQRSPSLAEGGWHWKEYSCSKQYPYICKHEHQGACSSTAVARATVALRHGLHQALNSSTTFSPPGTEATALCHSAERNVTVTCQQQQGGTHRWVSTSGVHPICPCPTGYELGSTGDCIHVDTCRGAPCGERACHSTAAGGFTCDDHEAPTVSSGQASPNNGSTPSPGDAEGASPRAITRQATPGTGPWPGSSLATASAFNVTLAASAPAPAHFSLVLVPVTIAAVALGVLTLFVVAVFKLCFRTKARDGKKGSATPATGHSDPEGMNGQPAENDV